MNTDTKERIKSFYKFVVENIVKLLVCTAEYCRADYGHYPAEPTYGQNSNRQS